MNLFGTDVYAILASTTEPNVVFSPASVMLALAMTRAGARGTTASEMDDVLHSRHAADTEAGFHRAINALTATLEERNGTFDVAAQRLTVEVSVANSLWGQKGTTWNPAFLDVLAGEYGAGMRAVDFIDSTEQARRTINEWVSHETNERIPELLAEGLVTSDIRLVLVNAMRMKAPWLHPFAHEATVEARFTTLDGTDVRVPTMRGSMVCGYARGDGWQAVDLEYVGGALSMMVVVPDAGAFDAVETEVATGLLDDVVAALAPADVNLELPRFELESKIDMKPVMGQLGMRAAFDPSTADFSGMTDDFDAYISFVVHQANITVDEKGTEAAAATAVGAGVTATPAEPVNLGIDRPFVWAVRDRPTGALLFLGRMGDPR